MKENNCALRDYIREIVKEEIAAHEERLTCNLKSLQDGKKVFPV